MNKLKSSDEIEPQWSGLVRPINNEKYQHYKGGLYEIVATGFLEESVEPCVIYRSLDKNTVWVRTAKNFLESINHNGIKQPRFKLI